MEMDFWFLERERSHCIWAACVEFVANNLTTRFKTVRAYVRFSWLTNLFLWLEDLRCELVCIYIVLSVHGE